MTLYAQWEEIAKVFYTVKFDANGGTGEMNKITAESGIEIAITENSFTKAGWKFSGWNTKSDGTGAPYNDKTKITLTADVTLYAQWAAGTGTAYKVEHWQQNITDDDYTLAKTEPMTGTTGEETAAKAEETAGFTAKEFAQAKIAADGSTVIKIYYDRKIITLTFDADNGEDKTTLSGKFGAEIVSPSPEKTDFIFSGWNTKSTPDESSKSYKDKEKITLTADVTLYAQWAAGTGTAYKVEHWQQNITDDDYTLAKTEPMTGTTGEETAAKAEETAGFTAKEFAQAKIAADGSTVIKIYYDRKIITLTFDADNGEDKTTLSGKFGAEIVPPSPEKTDFIFTGWNTDKIPTESSKSYKDKITLTEDLTLYAQWKEDVVNIIKNLTAGTHTVCVTGEIDETTVENIGEALRSNRNAKVNLDLSKTSGLESIPWSTFSRCTNLTEIKIPTSVTSIDTSAFDGCTSLSSIEIPINVTNIGWWAFRGCINLTSIKIPTSVRMIDYQAFVECCNVTSLYIENDNEYYRAFNNCIYTKNGQTLICVFGNPATISLLQSITKIGNSAFYNCTNLTAIEIPTGVTSIDDYAFEGCRSLINIKIPESVTSIDTSAFEDCTSLTDINIPESVTSIGRSAFERCTSLTDIKLPKNITRIKVHLFFNCISLTDIKIPESVTSIDGSAFYNCTSLINIEIPESVTSIGRSAFYRCPNLTTVNYMGTIEQWKKIDINEDENNSLLTAKIICTDGIINE